MEQSGKISVITKASGRPPTAKQLGVTAKETGMYHIVIDQGSINRHSLQQMEMGEKEIADILRKRGLVKSDVYLMMMDDTGDVTIIKKEEST